MEEKQFCVSIFIAASGVAKLGRDEAGKLTDIEVEFSPETTNYSSKCIGMAFPRNITKADEELIVRAVRDTIMAWVLKSSANKLQKSTEQTTFPQTKGDA